MSETMTPSAEIDFSAVMGRLYVSFRESPDAPNIKIVCNYSDCEQILQAAYAAQKRISGRWVLKQDAVQDEAGRLLFCSIKAKRDGLEWELSAPFGLMGWRWTFDRAEVKRLAAEAEKAICFEDARP
jgi:hypothetical protein